MKRKAAAPPGEIETKRFAGKREALLEGATELLNTVGLKGMTLANVGERVGLLTTSVTYYFKRKEDLAAACMLRSITRYEALLADARRERTTADRLTKFVTAYFAVLQHIRLRTEPPLAFFGDIAALEDEAGPVRTAYAHMMDQVVGLFADIPAGARQLRALLMLSLLYWTAVWAMRRDPDEYPRIAARFLDILLGGILAKPPRKWPTQTAVVPPEFAERASEPILIAASDLINRRGYRGASVEMIAARLNATRGAVYHHLADKEDLVVQCFARTFAIMRNALEETQHEGAAAQIASYAAKLARFQYSSAGPLLRVNAITALPQDTSRRMIRQSDRLADRLAGVISDAIADGSCRPIDAVLAAQMLSAAINSISELLVLTPQLNADEAIDAYLAPALSGLAH